jgi:hypothetical protein
VIRGLPTSAAARLAISLVVGVVVLLVVSLLSRLLLGLLSGIAGMGAVFLLTGLLVLWPMTPDSTRDNTQREDYRPHVEELLVAAAALGSLVVIVLLLALGSSNTRNSAAAIGLVGIFLTWAMLHLMYTARYAYLYYNEPVGGIDFNSKGPAVVPRLLLLQLQPGDDLPSIGHGRFQHRDPLSGAAALPAVIHLRNGDPRRDHQPRRRTSHELTPFIQSSPSSSAAVYRSAA